MWYYRVLEPQLSSRPHSSPGSPTPFPRRAGSGVAQPRLPLGDAPPGRTHKPCLSRARLLSSLPPFRASVCQQSSHLPLRSTGPLLDAPGIEMKPSTTRSSQPGDWRRVNGYPGCLSGDHEACGWREERGQQGWGQGRWHLRRPCWSELMPAGIEGVTAESNSESGSSPNPPERMSCLRTPARVHPLLSSSEVHLLK